MENEKIYVEKLDWKTQTVDMGLDEDDDNDGLIFGIAYIDFENEGDTLEYEWYKTEEERDYEIPDNAIILTTNQGQNYERFA